MRDASKSQDRIEDGTLMTTREEGRYATSSQLGSRTIKASASVMEIRKKPDFNGYATGRASVANTMGRSSVISRTSASGYKQTTDAVSSKSAAKSASQVKNSTIRGGGG